MTEELETTTTISDPNSSEPVAVRVLFVHDLPYSEHLVLGIFRLDDDSEIDFTGLAPMEQDKIDKACENEYIKSNSR